MALMTLASLRRAIATIAWLACALAASSAGGEQRVALLIGNNEYPSARLRNAVNDVRDLSAALRDLGFKTIVKENTSRAEMVGALQEFGKALDGAEAALFFYAGHAMQFKDRNYLIPVDAVMGSEDDVTFFSVEVSQVFDRMERAKTRFNFVVLDACRDNPFRESFKVSAAGLAQMSGPSGTMIGYATAPGQTAADGFGRNGLYTTHILQNIKIPDMPVEILFKRVREGVERDSKRQQTPWDLSSLKGDFVFNATGRAVATGGSAQGSGPSADVTAQLEREFWVSVRDSNRADDIQAYLDKYPAGTFAPLARNRLDALLGKTRVAAAPAPAAVLVPAAAAVPDAAPALSNAPRPASTAEQLKPPGSSTATPPPAVVAPAPAIADTRVASPDVRPPAGRSVDPKPPDAKPEVVAIAVPALAAQPAAAPAPKPRDEQPGREIAPGVREVTYSDGSIYRGAMRGIQLHGKGEYTSKAFKYEGEFKEGLKQGQGTYEWDSGLRYEGEFDADRPNGKGKFLFPNGDVYEGDVKAGVVAGRGIYVTKGGDRIEGSFADGRANGSGIYRFASGDRYEGDMVAGEPRGKGRYFTKSGDRIEGQFAGGRAQGNGTYYFANGDRYEGEMKEGALSGQGAYFYASGQKYEGELVNALPEGKGVFWFIDGSRFEGAFEKGLARAKGVVVKPDGTKTAAEMVDGDVRLVN